MEPVRVGVSSGICWPGRSRAAVDVLAGQVDAVELPALSEPELDEVVACVPEAVRRFPSVHVHAPVKGRQLAEDVLVARLDLLRVPVVVHPEVVVSPTLWLRLGSRLWLENNDGRKPFGATVDDLELMFARLPQARICLDVAHAQHAGGEVRVVQLVDLFGPRVVAAHVGCPCGGPSGGPVRAAELALLRNLVVPCSPLLEVVVVERAQPDGVDVAELVAPVAEAAAG